jgi:hypothetical protein
MSKIHWGHFADAPLPTSVAGAGYQAQRQALAAMPAMRREISRFKGTAFSAEREAETGDLVIFHHSNAGAPLSLDLTGDSAPGCGCGGGPHQRVDARAMQAIVERSRKRAGER